VHQRDSINREPFRAKIGSGVEEAGTKAANESGVGNGCRNTPLTKRGLHDHVEVMTEKIFSGWPVVRDEFPIFQLCVAFRFGSESAAGLLVESVEIQVSLSECGKVSHAVYTPYENVAPSRVRDRRH
jgi:hypothetical protein